MVIYKVLIVDDELIILETFAYLLEKMVLPVEAKFLDGSANVIETVKRWKPDFMFIDIHMPGKNGLEIVKELKKEDSEIKVFIITAYDYFDYAHKAIKLGVEDFILKPLKEEEIKGALEKHIVFSNKNSNQVRIDRAKKFIDKNLEKKITLNSVSEYINVSPYYLSHLFKEWGGITFQDYITQKRLEKIKEYLTNTFMSLKEITHRVGFSSEAYLINFFKKHTGYTPIKFREFQNNKKSK